MVYFRASALSLLNVLVPVSLQYLEIHKQDLKVAEVELSPEKLITLVNEDNVKEMVSSTTANQQESSILKGSPNVYTAKNE